MKEKGFLIVRMNMDSKFNWFVGYIKQKYSYGVIINDISKWIHDGDFDSMLMEIYDSDQIRCKFVG